MYIYIYIYLFNFVYLFIFHTYIPVRRVCMYVYIDKTRACSATLSVYIYIYVCMYVCMYIYICIHMLIECDPHSELHPACRRLLRQSRPPSEEEATSSYIHDLIGHAGVQASCNSTCKTSAKCCTIRAVSICQIGTWCCLQSALKRVLKRAPICKTSRIYKL